ncbi:MAG: class IV adenylate cyclase [Rhodothermales bacterium]|nr:class IV adenylate cyclase [Rhodothermales bacterium]
MDGFGEDSPAGEGRGGKKLIFEIKARCDDHEPYRRVLQEAGARAVGRDHQIDTYYDVPRGRLKLRHGTIENNLIHYRRHDEVGPKRSDVHLYRVGNGRDLNALLGSALDVLVEVDKQREIFFVGNVKIHLDRVDRLGKFVEIEAIDSDGTRSAAELESQCREWMDRFGIDDDRLVRRSYSDLLAELEADPSR